MADITQRGQLKRDDSGFPAAYEYKYITGTGAVIVKGSPAILHTITFNKPVATSVVTISDNATGTSAVILSVTVPASPMPVTLTYDVALNNGLVANVVTAASDLTISYV